MLLCLFYKNSILVVEIYMLCCFIKTIILLVEILKCEWNAWKYVLKNRIVINGKELISQKYFDKLK